MKMYKNIRGLTICGMILILAATSISCAGSKKSVQNNNDTKAAVSEKKVSDEDYAGTYRVTDAKVCNIVITIKKEKSDYSYTINGTGVKSSGKLKVVRDGSGTYLVFSGTKRSGDKTAVEGAFSDKTITVQNYGNSMNQYICFKSCDARYLEFKMEK